MEPIKFRVTVGGNTYEAYLHAPTVDDAKATLGLSITDTLVGQAAENALKGYAERLGEFLTQQLQEHQPQAAYGGLEGARITEEGIELLPVQDESEGEPEGIGFARPRRVIPWSAVEEHSPRGGSTLSEEARRAARVVAELDWRPIKHRSQVELTDVFEQAEGRRISRYQSNPPGDDARGVER